MTAIHFLPGKRTSFHAGLALACLAATAALLLHLIPELLVFPCPWKQIFGIPCFSCGTGRATTALLRLDLAAALRYNPLFCLALAAAGAVVLAWAVQLITAYRITLTLSPQQMRRLRGMAAALLLLNYAYLLHAGI